MNKKIIMAAILTASMLLNGCAENKESSGGSLSEQTVPSTGVSPDTGSAESSNGGAPEVVAPNFQGTSSSDVSSSEAPAISSGLSSYSDTYAEKPPHPAERDVIAWDEILTVSSGDTLYISGKMLDVEGVLEIENGGVVEVDEGGEIFVKGGAQIDGDLILSKGGRLTMGSEEAWANGDGNIIVQDNFEQIDCEFGFVYTHITPPERVVKDGVTTVGGVVIANKAIKLPPEYGSWLSDGEVADEVYSALMEMNSYSDHWYYIVSAYRSYYSQESIFQGWCDVYGFEEASRISSKAGHSEHQTGLTMDLDSLEEWYGDTDEGIWLAANCWKYGFIIRYPKGKEDITGYSYEPWHVRYLGKSTASLVYHSGLTLEEFLNVEGGMVVVD